MQRVQPLGTGAHIVGGALRRGLDQRIGPGLQIQESVKRVIDQRIGKAVELKNRAIGKMDVEQTQKRLMDMGKHIGRWHKFPGVAPAIIDAQERLFLRVPGDHRQEIGIGVARNRAVQRRDCQAAAMARAKRAQGFASTGKAGTSAASPWLARSPDGRSRICSSMGTRAAGWTGLTR